MRLHPLAPLIVVFALGCRPGSEAEAPAQRSGANESGASESSDPSDEVATTTRPANVIYRDELLRATQHGNAPYLLAQLGPEAYTPKGRFEGWIITRVWPGDPQLCAPGCDLQVGDVILSVNGSSFETPEQLSNALAELDAIERIELTGIRGGEVFQRSYAVLSPL